MSFRFGWNINQHDADVLVGRTFVGHLSQFDGFRFNAWKIFRVETWMRIIRNWCLHLFSVFWRILVVARDVWNDGKVLNEISESNFSPVAQKTICLFSREDCSSPTFREFHEIWSDHFQIKQRSLLSTLIFYRDNATKIWYCEVYNTTAIPDHSI